MKLHLYKSMKDKRKRCVGVREDVSNRLWDKEEKTKECLQKKINANKQCKQEKNKRLTTF